MRIISWNCRGLENLEAVRALRKLIHLEAPDIVFLMETKLYTSEMLRHRGMSGLCNIFPVQCGGRGRSRAGGLCLLWRSEVEVTVINASLHHILFNIVHPDHVTVPMPVYAIYGFPETQQNKNSGGDPPVLGQLQVSNQVCVDCGLTRVDYIGNDFAWSNNKDGPGSVEERLDYALVNQAWAELWPVSSVSHLIRHQSDHSPIFLHCGARKSEVQRHRVQLFRFEELWLESGEECAEVVAEGWGSPDHSFLSRIELVGRSLDSWGRAKYEDLTKRIKEARSLHISLLSKGEGGEEASCGGWHGAAAVAKCVREGEAERVGSGRPDLERDPCGERGLGGLVGEDEICW
ncbi:uncharacterized protein LOC130732797 [Lotus japonicus]|uniref:uncharacterized protein LOC130732797 n=1 Tax=Lotus japonicus TaxID=34305 RepID=UPI0025828608|nr:uncharacterized protein LOC130732797 [Lotus japonicus]